MKSTTNVRRVVLTIIGVFLAVAVAAGTISVEAAQSSPDFAIAISPTSQSVQQGATASYTVTVTSLNDFSGPVTLTTSGAPIGTALLVSTVTPTLLVSTVTPTPTVAGQVTLRVTTSTTVIGPYTITVSGVSGKLKHSATTGLTVNPVTPSFSLALTPASLSVDADSSGVYNVTLTRDGFTGDVILSVSALPEYVSYAFDPWELTDTASSATLTITVDPSAKARSSDITITGTSGSLLSASVQGTLVIAKPQGKPFTISGNVVGRLAPGVSQPIDLELFNTNKGFISVTNLTVSLTSTNKSSCSTDNFTVQQYTGTYPIAVPPNDSTKLSATQIDGLLPAITMLNMPGNQDSCKGVSLSLSYSGSAQGN